MPVNNPEIEAGQLDKRVTLLKPIYNDFEDEIVDWEPVADVWASIAPNWAQEIDEARRTVAIQQLPIVIRYRSDIDARWRIRDEGRTYEIEGPLDIQRRKAQLQLNCRGVA
jgi:SPP1 family predicted phage head-tail adaptor